MKRINLTKRTAAVLGLGVMVGMAPLAMAQDATMGGEAGTTDNLGAIDTSQQITTTTTTTQTEGGYGEYEVVGDNSAPLPNTGGEPLLFVLAGSTLIGGGLLLRRRMVHSGS